MYTSGDIQTLTKRINESNPIIYKIRRELSKVIIGQHYLLDRLLIALLSDGHVLLEGVPGLAKTLTVKSLAKCIDMSFSRIQFTPDLMPADVVGTMIFNQPKGEFVVRKGPVFANFILADEINRAPAKVQSALLEAMQEKQVTLFETTYHLPNPFIVFATQNPIEQSGTYSLPEAQLDRFMLKVTVEYPSKLEEQLILRHQVQGGSMPTINKVVDIKEMLEARELVKKVYLDEKIEQYIINIVFATRYPSDYGMSNRKNMLSYGASPRATIHLALAAKAYAFLQKRGHVLPDDVKAIAKDVLPHRLGLTYEAEAENITSNMIVEEIIQKIQAP